MSHSPEIPDHCNLPPKRRRQAGRMFACDCGRTWVLQLVDVQTTHGVMQEPQWLPAGKWAQ